MADELVTTSRQGPIAIVTLRGLDRTNALSRALRGQLLQALEQLMTPEDPARVVVLTGAGGTFCTGVCTHERATASDSHIDASELVRLARLLCTGDKPVIAAVEGLALNAGMALAAASDIVIGASNARCGCDSVEQGLLPDTGLLWTLVQRVGPRIARQMFFRPSLIDGAEAERIGLFNEVCEPDGALQRALEVAGEIAELPADITSVLKWSLVNGMSDMATALRLERELRPLESA